MWLLALAPRLGFSPYGLLAPDVPYHMTPRSLRALASPLWGAWQPSFRAGPSWVPSWSSHGQIQAHWAKLLVCAGGRRKGPCPADPTPHPPPTYTGAHRCPESWEPQRAPASSAGPGGSLATCVPSLCSAGQKGASPNFGGPNISLWGECVITGLCAFPSLLLSRSLGWGGSLKHVGPVRASRKGARGPPGQGAREPASVPLLEGRGVMALGAQEELGPEPIIAPTRPLDASIIPAPGQAPSPLLRASGASAQRSRSPRAPGSTCPDSKVRLSPRRSDQHSQLQTLGSIAALHTDALSDALSWRPELAS